MTIIKASGNSTEKKLTLDRSEINSGNKPEKNCDCTDTEMFTVQHQARIKNQPAIQIRLYQQKIRKQAKTANLKTVPLLKH